MNPLDNRMDEHYLEPETRFRYADHYIGCVDDAVVRGVVLGLDRYPGRLCLIDHGFRAEDGSIPDLTTEYRNLVAVDEPEPPVMDEGTEVRVSGMSPDTRVAGRIARVRRMTNRRGMRYEVEIDGEMHEVKAGYLWPLARPLPPFYLGAWVQVSDDAPGEGAGRVGVVWGISDQGTARQVNFHPGAHAEVHTVSIAHLGDAPTVAGGFH